VSEVYLYAFQVEELLGAVKLVTCCLALAVGIALWVHATYIRKDKL